MTTVTARQHAQGFNENMQPLIHIFQNNSQEGPYTIAQVRAMLDSGTVSPSTLAWKAGMLEWTPLGTVLPASPSPGSTSPMAPRITPPTAVAPIPVSVAPSTTSGPRGVGGWLLFFCVALTIVGPLLSFGHMSSAWEESQPAFERFPSFMTAIVWENVCLTTLLLYGLVVGCMIWSGNPNGRVIAKRYLLIRLYGFIGIEIIALFLLGDLPAAALTVCVGGILGTGLREVLYFLIWWLYFKKSKRVRNTYGVDAGALAGPGPVS